MLTEWFITTWHALLCAVMVVGVLYSKTPIAQGAVLATLIILFFGVRMFDACAMDEYERKPGQDKPILTEMGRAMSLKEPSSVSNIDFEQIVIANLILVQIIKIYANSIFPFERLF
jgi:hypothetical protein